MDAEKIIKVDGLNQLADKARAIYKDTLKEILEPEYIGQIVAIEVDSGDWFLGESVVDAALKARQKYPDKLFHFIRIGFRAVHKKR